MSSTKPFAIRIENIRNHCRHYSTPLIRPYYNRTLLFTYIIIIIDLRGGNIVVVGCGHGIIFIAEFATAADNNGRRLFMIIFIIIIIITVIYTVR